MKRRDFIVSSISSGLVGATILSGLSKTFAASAPEGRKKNTSKRGLIIYATHTNNTTRVAERFKSTLERNGWQCDIFKVGKGKDAPAFPYNIKDYALVCAGSGINMHEPYEELLTVIRGLREVGAAMKNSGSTELPTNEQMLEKIQKAEKGQMTVDVKKDLSMGHGKIVFSPDGAKCISFATFGGMEFGPWEAQPALDLINVEVAHSSIEPVGTFCCPGKFLPFDVPSGYYTDLTTRPNEKDLMRAELFIEQVLEAIGDRRTPAT